MSLKVWVANQQKTENVGLVGLTDQKDNFTNLFLWQAWWEEPSGVKLDRDACLLTGDYFSCVEAFLSLKKAVSQLRCVNYCNPEIEGPPAELLAFPVGLVLPEEDMIAAARLAATCHWFLFNAAFLLYAIRAKSFVGKI